MPYIEQTAGEPGRRKETESPPNPTPRLCRTKEGGRTATKRSTDRGSPSKKRPKIRTEGKRPPPFPLPDRTLGRRPFSWKGGGPEGEGRRKIGLCAGSRCANEKVPQNLLPFSSKKVDLEGKKGF
jgi:hypothetical protein